MWTTLALSKMTTASPPVWAGPRNSAVTISLPSSRRQTSVNVVSA